MHSRASAFGSVPGRQRHSFLRKFRSHDTVRPAAFAACAAANVASAAAREMEGVMPVTWNQPAPPSVTS